MTFNIKIYNNIAEEGLKKLDAEHYTFDDTLAPDGVLLRSESLHDKDLPESVLAVARAGAGTNNIPIADYTEKGVIVFNTPGANANAVKELVLGSMLLSVRPILQGITWAGTLESPNLEKTVEQNKKQFVGTELEGKTLGVIGLGAIGSRVANDAYQIGMNVLGYDPHVSVDTAWKMSRRVKRVLSVDEIFAKADFISIHVPLLKDTKNFISTAELEKMKETAVLLNFSRGGLVDHDAVVKAVTEGQIGKYVTDFPEESLLNVPNIVLLPHLGASTEEAEINCAKSAAKTLKVFLETGNILNAVNFPRTEMTFRTHHRLSIFHQNVPNMIGKISQAIADGGVNINNLTNRSHENLAYTIIDLDDVSEEKAIDLLAAINLIDEVIKTRLIVNPEI